MSQIYTSTLFNEARPAGGKSLVEAYAATAHNFIVADQKTEEGQFTNRPPSEISQSKNKLSEAMGGNEDGALLASPDKFKESESNRGTTQMTDMNIKV